jgi:hypothetical protein
VASILICSLVSFSFPSVFGFGFFGVGCANGGVCGRVGRRVLAKVLGLQTVHWKDCVLSLEEEKGDAERFKGAFKEFDFSL